VAVSEAGAGAVVIVIASTVVFGRVLFEVAIITPAQLGAIAPPLIAMMLVMVALSAVSYLTSRTSFERAEQEQEPPSELGAAIVFGLLYAAVLLGVAAAKANFGEAGMYVVAGLSGLTDMDAITLSTSQLVRSGDLGVATGWRLILVGALANLVFKGAIVVVLGTRKLASRVLTLFGLGMAAGIALLLLWPG
jgi:uncharacterized membrane protein (DUF4010 family)